MGIRDCKVAEHIKLHVEMLVAAKITATPLPSATAEWLAGVDDRVRQKIEAWGLAEPRQQKRVPTLGELINEYLELRRAQVASQTLANIRQAANSLLSCLPADTPLDHITPADADRVYAKFKDTLASSSANKYGQICKMFFRFAQRRGYIAANPFEEIRGLRVIGDPNRRMLIPASEVKRLLDVIDL